MTVPDIYSDAWRLQYLGRRYLEFLSPADLGQRYSDLLGNVLGFSDSGRPRLVGLREETGWTRRIADVVAEANLRLLPREWLDAVERGVLQRPYPRVLRAIEAWGTRRPEPGSYIVKYGQREHMIALVERGSVRLTPASDYNDPSLSPAIRDDELQFATHFPPGTKLQVEREDGSGVYQDADIAGLLTNTRQCEDFYVFCASGTFDPRSFDDFDRKYDACVLIRDWRRFIDAIKSCPPPAGKISAKSTVYLDPFFSHRSAEVPFTKHMRYRYQQEWRIVWTEPLHAPPLQPFFLELGSLSSYCELITL